MADITCSKCGSISDETHRRLVQSGRIDPGADRCPPAICFLRNDGGEGGSWLEPVCGFHRGECVLTVVSLEDGMGEYSVQVVMGS